MAKAEIIEDLGAGKYSIKRMWGGRTNLQVKIDLYNAEIVKLQNKHDSMPVTTFDELFEKNIIKLQIASLQKKVDYLTNNFPTDKTVDAWCADYTEGLTGDIGTIDIPGEYTADVNIRPGDIASNTYDAARDGDLIPAIGLGPWTNLLDLMIYPGWQKFKPLHRYAWIVSGTIDRTANTCAVAVMPTFSLMNYNVNKSATSGGQPPAAEKGLQSSRVKNFNVNYGDTLGREEIELIRDGVAEVDYGSEFFIQNSASAHPGFIDFVERYPTHPISDVSQLLPPVYLTDEKYIQIKRICRKIDYFFRYESDQSGYEVSDHWDVMYDWGDPWYWTPTYEGEPQQEPVFAAITLEYDDSGLVVGLPDDSIESYYTWGTYSAQNVEQEFAADRLPVIGPRPKRTGDCEDYVLTKMQAIIEAGILPPGNLQVLLCYVINAGYHAVLGIQTTNRGFLISDQRDYGQLWEIEQLSRTHFWESFSIATAAGGGSTTWAKTQVILKDVPIEYMGCDASAFADNDEVIVEFTDQDWATPKVIGFKENPVSCAAVRILPDGTGFSYSGDEAPAAERTGVFSFFYSSETWTLQGTFSGILSWFASCTGTTGIVYRVGGYDLGTGGLYEVKPVYTDEHWAYDVRTASWQAATASGLEVCKQRYKFIGNGNAILYGGEELTDSQYWGDAVTFPANVFYSDTKRYSFSSDAWISMLAFRARSHPACFALDDVVYVAGGHNTQYIRETEGVQFNDGVYSFWHVYETWTTKQSLPANLGSAAGFGLNGRGYVGGGCQMHRYQTAAELPNSILWSETWKGWWAGWNYDSWTYTARIYCNDDSVFNLNNKYGALRQEHHPFWVGEPVGDEDVLEYRPIVGDYGGFINTGVGLYYDPLGDAWSIGTCHPSYSWSYNGFAHTEIENNQKGVRVGGGRGSGSTGAWVLDEATDSWSTKGGYDPTWSKKFGQSGIGISA